MQVELGKRTDRVPFPRTPLILPRSSYSYYIEILGDMDVPSEVTQLSYCPELNQILCLCRRGKVWRIAKKEVVKNAGREGKGGEGADDVVANPKPGAMPAGSPGAAGGGASGSRTPGGSPLSSPIDKPKQGFEIRDLENDMAVGSDGNHLLRQWRIDDNGMGGIRVLGVSVTLEL